MESVLTTVKRGRIAIFTLNRPEKYNALNPALIQALEEAMLDFMEDPDLYAVSYTHLDVYKRQVQGAGVLHRV